LLGEVSVAARSAAYPIHDIVGFVSMVAKHATTIEKIDMNEVELLSGTTSSDSPWPPGTIARGSIFVSGREVGLWEVQTGSRWSATLLIVPARICSKSKAELKRKISEEIDDSGAG
jgi:hypothetical protein